MSASPRTMWSGSIRLGLLNVPVTIGKATSEQREKSLITVCEQHETPIDRSERCGAGHKNCTMSKVKAVIVDEAITVLAKDDVKHIEEATKDDTLPILDVQPLSALPMEYGMSSYYVRPDKKVKGSEEVFALLFEALATMKNGIVTKLSSASSQRLAVIHAYSGVLMLTQIPFMDELRKPGEEERKHWKVDHDEKLVEMATDLLMTNQNVNGFQWDSYENEGFKLRSEAVQAVIENNLPVEDVKENQEEKPKPVTDLVAMLKASLNKED